MTWQKDMQCQLKEMYKNLVAYSIATDRSTDIKGNVQFAGFIQGVNEDFQLL